MKKVVFVKEQLEKIREGNAYVQPDMANSSSSNIASDISSAQKDNPTDNSFVLDTSHYDGDASNNEPTLTINAKNAQDAQQQYNNMQKNPNTKRVMDAGATCQVNMQKENTIRYTKKELNKILFR